MDPVDAARHFARYAKDYHAGGFGAPTAAELARSTLIEWSSNDGLTLAVEWRPTRVSRRRDWTGRTYEVPAGARIITHLARTGTAPVPDLSAFDLVYAYREDRLLSDAMAAQGREVWAAGITAASEIIVAWGRGGSIGCAPVDLVTVAEVPFSAPMTARREALAEVAAIDGWRDDYPYYTDGSWSAVSLRGFRPDDPTWGVKPAEMGRKWQAEHPEALGYECGWTVLAERCPTLVGLVRSTSWWGGLERVRLLRMSGRDGRGGVLRRHTDITDRAGGTRDGQIVRFHVPIVTDPAILLHVWDLDGAEIRRHLAPWRAWYLDARKPHAVTNPTGVDRIHLVADVVADEAVRAVILEAGCASRI